MTNIIVSEVRSKTALIINDGDDVLVVRSMKIIAGRPVYDLRRASVAEIRHINNEGTNLEDKSAEFLRALSGFVSKDAKEFLRRIF